jgi:hypothetical protein
MKDEVQATVEGLAAQGLSLAMIGDEVGLTPDAVRSRLLRRGLRATPHREVDVRRRAEAMPPRDAVEYLLGVVENLLDVMGGHQHPVDGWARWRICERRLVRALYDADGKLMTRQHLMSALYYDRSADEFPMDKIIDVFICRVRPRLPAGVQIVTRWGQGWAMDVPAELRGSAQ